MNTTLQDETNRQQVQKSQNTEIRNNTENNKHENTIDTTDRETQGTNHQFALAALENIIRQRLAIIEKAQLEIAELNQQLKNILENSEEYYKAEKALKEAMKIKKQIKATIMGTQEAKDLQEKFEAAKNELKEEQNALSEMLLEYYETMRVKEIDDEEGNTRDLIVNVRVAPKRTKK